ncbi:outer membrane beta-barrel protein [Cecembia sp.]|uniref:outer membrane beta-barrel protein n=1 Tax=Cecembia sp. TaxID=1898110 RepID=UPI0025BD637C|nr:outer membrane beta-barrel protein [Cecembia sp.]
MMKRTTIILLAMFLSTWSFGQVEESAPKANVTVFSLFDTKIEKTDHGDGRKTWEISPGYKAYDEQSFREKKVTNSVEMNLDIGINTWINAGDAPSIRPWGSWNPAINMAYSYKPGKNFSLKSMLGVSWYNFKFEDSNIQALRGPEGIVFNEFEGEARKSKITSSYLNLTLIPSFHSNDGNFRIGVGPYVGYRLGGRGKLVAINENGNRDKIFQRANMFANDIRFGGRLEIGVGEIDLFVNYDINNYFQKDKGPELNALSFGIIL